MGPRYEMWSNFFQTLYMSGKDSSGLFWTLDVVTNFASFQTDRAGCHYLETRTSPFLQFLKKNGGICSRDVWNKVRW